MSSVRRFLCGLLALVVVVGGCTSEESRFTVLSTKNVEISRVDLKRAQFTRDVKGSDSCFWFLFIPIPPAGLSWQRATDDCLREGRGDFVTSARFEHFHWSLLVVGWDSYHCVGDVGNSLSAGSRDIEGAEGSRTARYESDALAQVTGAAPATVTALRGLSLIGVEGAGWRGRDGATGVRVMSVGAGTAADRAGIVEGDAILSADGSDDLEGALSTRVPGDQVTLRLDRNGRRWETVVVVGTYRRGRD